MSKQTHSGRDSREACYEVACSCTLSAQVAWRYALEPKWLFHLFWAFFYRLRTDESRQGLFSTLLQDEKCFQAAEVSRERCMTCRVCRMEGKSLDGVISVTFCSQELAWRPRDVLCLLCVKTLPSIVQDSK